MANEIERIVAQALGGELTDEQRHRLIGELGVSWAGFATDAARELDKAADALDVAARHFEAQGQADAALHLAEVRYNPLAAKVMGAVQPVRLAADRFRSYGNEAARGGR